MDTKTLKEIICNNIIDIVELNKVIDVNYDDYVSEVQGDDRAVVWLLNDTLKKIICMKSCVEAHSCGESIARSSSQLDGWRAQSSPLPNGATVRST
jgi:hypothetical protein